MKLHDERLLVEQTSEQLLTAPIRAAGDVTSGLIRSDGDILEATLNTGHALANAAVRETATLASTVTKYTLALPLRAGREAGAAGNATGENLGGKGTRRTVKQSAPSPRRGDA